MAGKGSKSNKDKGKRIAKKRNNDNDKYKKQKKEIKTKTKKMLLSPAMQKLFFAAMLRQLKTPEQPSPPHCSGYLTDSSDDGPNPSPPTTEDDEGEESEGSERTNDVMSDSGEQSSLPDQGCPSPQSATKEEEWIVDNHVDSPTNIHVTDVLDNSPLPPPPPPSPDVTCIDSEAESLVIEVEENEVQELLVGVNDGDVSEDIGGGEVSVLNPLPGTSSVPPAVTHPCQLSPCSSSASPPAAASCSSTAQCSATAPCSAAAWAPATAPCSAVASLACQPASRPVTTTTYTDRHGQTKLFFDPTASPFLVRNQIVENSLHRMIDFNLGVIKDSTSDIRPCLPFQNETCSRIAPIHGSHATGLQFSHVCILCLFAAGLPLPHPLTRCPFAIPKTPSYP